MWFLTISLLMSMFTRLKLKKNITSQAQSFNSAWNNSAESPLYPHGSRNASVGASLIFSNPSGVEAPTSLSYTEGLCVSVPMPGSAAISARSAVAWSLSLKIVTSDLLIIGSSVARRRTMSGVDSAPSSKRPRPAYRSM